LIKNVEAKGISIEALKKEIFKNENNSDTLSDSDISKNIIRLLNITDKKDIMNIEIYIKTLSQDKDEDTDGPKFNERFIAMFNEVIVYDEGKERKYQIKLKDKLKVYEAKIKKLVSLFDVNNKGFITFANLRRIFEEIHLSLKETYIEYLIYKMKKYDSPENKLEDLKYDVNIIINIINI